MDQVSLAIVKEINRAEIKGTPLTSVVILLAGLIVTIVPTLKLSLDAVHSSTQDLLFPDPFLIQIYRG